MTTSGHGRGTLALVGAFTVLAALIIPTRPSAGAPLPAHPRNPAPVASASAAAPSRRAPSRHTPSRSTPAAPALLPVRSERPSPRTRASSTRSPSTDDSSAGGSSAGGSALHGTSPRNGSPRNVYPRKAAAGCPVPTAAPVHRAPGTDPTVALTFDDGPSRYTPELLDLLRREHVHATFFVIGANAANDPGMVARTAREGHLVGDHTWHHRYPAAVRGGWTSSYLRTEMLTTRRAITAATGAPVCWFRPPAGFTSPALFSTTGDLGLSVALWSVDTLDWQLQTSSHESGAAVTGQIVARASQGLDQQHPVILMHDGGGYRGAGVAAVARIIRTYRDHGYRFVRLDGSP